MAEGVGVSDEQLDELTAKLSVQDFRSARPLMYAVVGGVRASHAREAALLRAESEWMFGTEQLQERIDKALLLCDRGLLIRTEAIRAALTGTGDTE